MQNKNIMRIVVVTVCILLIPLIIMQFTDEVNWDLADFAVAGAILLGAGIMYELITGKMDNFAYRAAVALAVLTALFLIWVNLAVGMIGTEDNPANLMYGGVIFTGIIGALISRLRPNGLASAMFVTAIAQILVGAIALIAELGGTLVPDLFFAVLWFGSALLFRRAGGIDHKIENSFKIKLKL